MRPWSSKALRATLLGVALLASQTVFGQARDLPEIQEKGVIRVAMYNDYPPYSARGKGIDLEVAEAVAKRLKVRLDPLWFDADENVDDDLRNMVWKGHYLGHGPADAMIHAPIDPELARRNPQVRFVAPYYRERLAIARSTARVPRLDDLSFLDNESIGAEDASLASIVLLSYQGGKYREKVRHFKSPTAAMEALKKGEIAAVMAQQAEAQGLLKGAGDFTISPPPLPGGIATRQWVLGVAVKAGHKDLAAAIEKAMTELAAEGELERIFARHGVSYTKP